jgi:CheY-like chemotaxis protein
MKTVLVIEDNPLNMELVVDLLEANGCRVLQAASAEEGLNLARENSPDLVLMDLSLPGMDGLAATRVLKSDPDTRKLTIIALTAHAMRGDQNNALAAGCDGYLSKPIDVKSFASRIDWFIATALAD